ncbi:MAG TPA: class I SAM-dependent methyltransferase [Solirubrobacterales bacterium]|nr:class I SAM-dependent methyltransferase [Solirubrobacterales bacterium]
MSGGTNGTSNAQDARSIEKNKTFFADNSAYAENVAELDTYRNIRAVIDAQVRGSHRLLDIGNGGVFDYDTSLADSIVGVDLFLDETSVPDLPKNVTLRRGDALALDEGDGSYDRVLLALVFHHLAGRTAMETVANIRQAIKEAHRVLEAGGRLVTLESCVSKRFYAIERQLFRPLTLIAGTPLMQHPATLQLPPRMIADLIGEAFQDVKIERVPIGRWVLQFGLRWPSALTPARPFLITATKS